MQTTFKVNISTILVIVMAGVMFFFWNKNKNSEITRITNNVEIVSDKFETYKAETDGTIVAKDLAYQMLEDELRNSIESDSIQRELTEKYKKLSAVVKYETVFVDREVEVKVPVYIDKDTTLSLSSPCYSADLSVTSGSLTLSGLTIDNRQDIVLGERKNGLRKSEYSLDIRNTNPCIQTTGVTTYIVVHEKKWYENPIITGGLGLTAGFIGGMIVNK